MPTATICMHPDVTAILDLDGPLGESLEVLDTLAKDADLVEVIRTVPEDKPTVIAIVEHYRRRLGTYDPSSGLYELEQERNRAVDTASGLAGSAPASMDADRLLRLGAYDHFTNTYELERKYKEVVSDLATRERSRLGAYHADLGLFSLEIDRDSWRIACEAARKDVEATVRVAVAERDNEIARLRGSGAQAEAERVVFAKMQDDLLHAVADTLGDVLRSVLKNKVLRKDKD